MARPKGRWERPTGMMPPEYFGRCMCSECGHWAMLDCKHHRMVRTRFCPGCGAEMEGADDEEGGFEHGRQR